MRKIFYIPVLLITVVLILGCVGDETTNGEREEPLLPVQMEFSSTPRDDLDAGNSSILGVKETTWVGSTLEIKAYVKINKGEEMQGGDYTIEGTKITLKYISPKCAGLCPRQVRVHELTYTFRNLPKKDYTFELVRVEE